jgi:uncharacterized repeat protein (TIGR01451 family)/LPXTG-motif cell wall-anchored protein
MKAFFAAIKRSPKLAVFTAALIGAVVVPASLLAWGPTRATYTIEHPATSITFNSITNNPDYGDERNFTRIKDAANTNPGGWSDQVTVQPGKEYLVQMYVHNNAATSLNLVAKNTRVMATVPNNTAKQITVEGFISADNATPNQVWDQAIFNGASDFNLTYQPGSTKLYNKVFPNGTAMSDSIVTSAGAPFGYNQLDGNLPGCFNYSGYVSFKVKVNTPKSANFTMSKQVSKHGANNWQENYAAAPGETVDYLIRYKNTDTAQQNNVVVKDTLPDGMSYVNGSTKYGTSAHPDGVQATDDITGKGINIGSYAQNGGTFVIFSAKVAGNDSLPSCGANTLRNLARVETDYGFKEDTADVTVNRVCQPGQTPTPTPTPVTPAELPQTGIDTGIMTFVGLGVMVAGAAYAVTSERVRNLLRS